MANELTRAIMAKLAGGKPAAEVGLSPCGTGNLSPQEETLLTGLIGAPQPALSCREPDVRAGADLPAAGRQGISLSELARLHGHSR